MGPCTGLESLVISLSPRFSEDTHAGVLKTMLSSWKPQHKEFSITLHPRREDAFTRRAFVDALRVLGAVAETWIQTFEELHPADKHGHKHDVKYRLRVLIYDLEGAKELWMGHLRNCFPTWCQSRRLGCIFRTREYPLDNADISLRLTL